jgi:hypothetical protein
MNNSTPGAIIKFDENGNVIQFNVIASSDKEATMVQQKLKPITRPSAWAKFKRLLQEG